MLELKSEPTQVLHMRVPTAQYKLIQREAKRVDITVTRAAAQILTAWAEKKLKKVRK